MPDRKPAKIRAVFFDAVGTLLFPAVPVAHTYQAIARRHGADLEEAVIHSRIREAFVRQEEIDRTTGWRTSEPREADRWRRIVRETLHECPSKDDCFVELWEWYRTPEAWIVHPETAMVLQELARNQCILGMGSNFDARLAEIVSANKDLHPLAERCVISSLVGWRKPSAAFFAEVIRQAGCAPAEVLFVGDDRRNDVEGARTAGMHSVLLDPKGVSSSEVIRTLSELLTQKPTDGRPWAFRLNQSPRCTDSVP